MCITINMSNKNIMTTEQIENLANNLAEEYERFKDELTVENYIKRVIEITNLHWQEKARWKSLETEPPKFEGQKYQVLVRFAPGIYDVVCIIGLRSIERAIAAGYKDWKEIE